MTAKLVCSVALACGQPAVPLALAVGASVQAAMSSPGLMVVVILDTVWCQPPDIHVGCSGLEFFSPNPTHFFTT